MRRRSQSYWLMGSAMLCEIQTVTDKTRDAAVSARPSRVTRAVEMTTLRFIRPDTSRCGRPRCRQPPSQPQARCRSDANMFITRSRIGVGIAALPHCRHEKAVLRKYAKASVMAAFASWVQRALRCWTPCCIVLTAA